MNLVNTVIFLGAIIVVGVGYVFAQEALRRRRLNRRLISQHDGYVLMRGTRSEPHCVVVSAAVLTIWTVVATAGGLGLLFTAGLLGLWLAFTWPIESVTGRDSISRFFDRFWPTRNHKRQEAH